MRIAHYLKRISLAEGGVVRAVLDLCGALAQAGHEVTLITYDPSDVPPEWGEAGARAPRVVTIPPPTIPGGVLGARAKQLAADVIRESDCLHLHAVWTTSNAQLAALARRAGKPYVVSIHGMLDDWSMSQRRAKKTMYLRLFGRRVLESARVVHCTAQFERDQAVKWFPRGSATVIPLVFDLSPFANPPGPEIARGKYSDLAGGAKSLLFLSRLHEKKRPELLLRALRLLLDRGMDVHAFLAGTGEPAYVQSLRSLAGELELDGRAHFLGLVVGPEKVSLYQAADLFVLPTSQENFGFVLPEALACATPAITTKGVDIWPELEESGGAVIVEPDPEPIANAAQELLEDDARRGEMGRKGRDWVFSHLDGARVVSEYERMYEQAAACAS